MIRLIFLLFALLFLSSITLAVTPDEIDKLLYRNQLERASVEIQQWIKDEPSNPEAVRRLGFLYLLQARTSSSEPDAKRLRLLARQAFLRARDLGDRDDLAGALLDSIPDDGGATPTMSQVPEAEKAMRRAENAFADGRYPQAVLAYREAAKLDPELYYAPLYEGDAWLKQGELKSACECYQKASLIDPNREAAYRYWGNALSRLGEVEQGLEKYAEAVVAEPMSKLAWNRGLGAWAKVTGATLDIPKIRIKTGVTKDGKQISVDSADVDGTLAPWLMYAATLAIWKRQVFSERFDGEAYRQTLAEESEALSAVAKAASELADKDEIKLDKDLDLLIQLQSEGMMEPFVFFSRPSASILQDYPAYRDKNRDKLVRFVVDYVVQRDTL